VSQRVWMPATRPCRPPHAASKATRSTDFDAASKAVLSTAILPVYLTRCDSVADVANSHSASDFFLWILSAISLSSSERRNLQVPQWALQFLDAEHTDYDDSFLMDMRATLPANGGLAAKCSFSPLRQIAPIDSVRCPSAGSVAADLVEVRVSVMGPGSLAPNVRGSAPTHPAG
jgi:hypothetical protein